MNVVTEHMLLVEGCSARCLPHIYDIMYGIYVK